jgi:F-type H+-transporting ATPase subunit a
MTDLMSSFAVTSVIPIELFGVDLSLTNSALFMLAAVALTLFVFFVGTADRGIVPGKFQVVVEKSLDFVSGMTGNVSESISSALLPYVCSLFFFIAFGNVLGLFPYAFSFTGQLVVTFGLAIMVFATSIVVGLTKQRWKYFRHFCPSGIPIYIAPLFVALEVMSFAFRPISLGIRLFANIVSGHLIIKVIAGFAVALTCSSAAAACLSVVPIMVDIFLNIFKLAICVLQAYVFVVLTCIYLSESFETNEH